MIHNKTPALLIGGKLTLFGAFKKCQDELAAKQIWTGGTPAQYEAVFRNLIVPALRDHDRKPLSAYSRQELEAAVETIRRKGYEQEGVRQNYADITLDKIRYLIRITVQAAADDYLCMDVFAEVGDNQSRKNQKCKAAKLIPKSMTPEQEIRAGQALLTDPMQSGQRMGLAAMFCLGLRNGEGAGLNFGDIKIWRGEEGFWVAWIYKTTAPGTNQLQSGGKTCNADRVIPVPDRFVWLVLERKRRLQELLGDTCNVDELPIACKDNDYFTRCSADDLTQAAKDLFRQIDILPEQIMAAYEDMQRELDSIDPLLQTDEDILTRDPTAYFLRRVGATGMAMVGLTEPEIAYCIGHDIEDPRETRNGFLRTDKLLEIKKKLDKRAVVNGAYQTEEAVALVPGQTAAICGSGRKIFKVPPETKRVHMHLQTEEPLDVGHVTVTAGSANSRMRIDYCQYELPASGYPVELDVVQDYHRIYRDKEEKAI